MAKVKCDCTHTAKVHHNGEGACSKCACTWYHPNAQSVIGRNNKNRGRKFERDVADLLGWTRVPYSGGSAEWGGADVVDGFYKKKGWWAAECKTQVVEGDKPANISIKHKWVGQMLGGETSGRNGIIIVRRIRKGGKPGVKGPRAYVFMLDEAFDWFRRERIARGGEMHICACAPAIKTRGNGHNFTVPASYLITARGETALHIAVMQDGEQTNWYIFDLEGFAEAIKKYDIMEHDDDKDQH